MLQPIQTIHSEDFQLENIQSSYYPENNSKKNNQLETDLQINMLSLNSNQEDPNSQQPTDRNKVSQLKINHRSSLLKLKEENRSYIQEEQKPTTLSPNRQYLNFPQIDNLNKKRPIVPLQNYNQQRKSEVCLNAYQSLPKLKKLSEYQIANYLPSNNYQQQKNKYISNETNEYNSYLQQQQKSKNQRSIHQKPLKKLGDYLITDQDQENGDRLMANQKSISDKYKSLLQLRLLNSESTNQNLATQQNNSSIFQIRKEKISIPYLSTKIEQQQQKDLSNQQLAIKRFNESIDRRFKFSCKTKAGCTFDKNPKTNQDSPIIYPKQLGEQGISLFAVCDGHGVNGHLISGMIRKNLHKHVLKYLKIIFKKQQKIKVENDKSEKEEKAQTSNEGIRDLDIQDFKNCIQQAFYAVNSDILKSEVDSNLSGSTLVSVFIHGKTIICSNVGDSRAVLARKKNGNEIQAIPLSIDHKPCFDREKQRIIQSGGRVQSQKDHYGNPIGPLRVWMSSLDIPGLAMTRSFGDKVGIQAGVNCEPEILESEINEDDQFIIVASDGLWEYLSNYDAVKLVQPYYEKGQVDLAAERLVIEASNAWKRESLSRDDITCIVIFFQKTDGIKEDEKQKVSQKIIENNQ
ncbi:protein phosphatase 2C containing protein (macronuclear) [Tetrahymena thermophila SB210]|uniref:Protein phosphatase 2C containing protein n=1 Tax=Tetrahymena thermophila (strain SB210) TaxID=312017 RepID=Q22LY0_TETTS|nr:protein phosphatase 2C containing protein [Tetrahymena thermophila SB210]EAR86481.2 protein phosphatase 2C containing protein [Tetrahymena thermophila SB210]|eukprot:XP_977240.2 protein phosphatase 2C containing protein [Tetrahymena thermophila SB210]